MKGTLCDMGEVLEKLGRYEEAISYNKVAELDPAGGESLRYQVQQGKRLQGYRGTVSIGGIKVHSK